MPYEKKELTYIFSQFFYFFPFCPKGLWVAIAHQRDIIIWQSKNGQRWNLVIGDIIDWWRARTPLLYISFFNFFTFTCSFYVLFIFQKTNIPHLLSYLFTYYCFYYYLFIVFLYFYHCLFNFTICLSSSFIIVYSFLLLLVNIFFFSFLFIFPFFRSFFCYYWLFILYSF